MSNPEVHEVKSLAGAKRVDAGDLSLFDAVLSQTSSGDRRSFLAVQRAMLEGRSLYTYLEIGSHLGGTIQPHLADERCRQIFSIDPRPVEVPDDRAGLSVWEYEGNSSARMLSGLTAAALGNIDKIQCIEKDASEVGLSEITEAPLIVFIDGEHTVRAVLSDFKFCQQVIHPQGVILFHDFGIVFPAIRKICRGLKQQKVSFRAIKLEGSLFAIFLDPSLVEGDEYLAAWEECKKHYLAWWTFRCRLSRLLPGSVFKGLQSLSKKLRT